MFWSHAAHHSVVCVHKDRGLNSVNSVIGCELRADVVQYLAVS